MNDLTENAEKNVSSNQSVVGCQSDQSMSFEAYSSPIGVRRQFTGRVDNSVKKYTFKKNELYLNNLQELCGETDKTLPEVAAN